MKIRTVGYFFKESLKSLFRNGWMSVASVATVAVSLFICGVFWLLVLNVNNIATSLESEVEIRAFIREEVPQSQSLALQKEIAAYPGTKEVTFVSKEEALLSLKKQFGNEQSLLAALDGKNPLPDSLVIKTKAASDVIPIAQRLEKNPLLEKVRYGKGIVEKLFALINWVRLLGLGMMILLAVGAVVLIAITIRLTVYSRRREITIMKYVGATDWFIRWPFLLEGMFLGLLGSLCAAGVLFWAYAVLLDNISTSLGFIKLVQQPEALWQIALGLMVLGTFLGATGSVISLRRFLRV